MKNQLIKIIFGLVIFLFGTALAYFTADYMRTNYLFDYWGTIALFACAYLIIGIIVAKVLSISLGFLFAADVLILHLLFEYYGQWDNVIKLTIIGGMLIFLYAASAFWLTDAPDMNISNSPLPPPGKN